MRAGVRWSDHIDVFDCVLGEGVGGEHGVAASRNKDSSRVYYYLVVVYGRQGG